MLKTIDPQTMSITQLRNHFQSLILYVRMSFMLSPNKNIGMKKEHNPKQF